MRKARKGEKQTEHVSTDIHTDPIVARLCQALTTQPTPTTTFKRYGYNIFLYLQTMLLYLLDSFTEKKISPDATSA